MRDHPDAVMMFAAGFGTRMKALTQDQPKPMIKVAGRPLIDHALALTESVAPERIVVNLHYKPTHLIEHLSGRDVRTILEAPDILETGGGLRHALPLLGNGPVYTMNSDAIWSGPNPLALLRDAWQPDRMDALLMCVPTDQAIGHSGKGDFVMDRDGRLVRGRGLIYGGVEIIKTTLLETVAAQAFSLNLIWDRMQTDGRLFGLAYPGRWCDVGQPESIPLAEALLDTPHV